MLYSSLTLSKRARLMEAKPGRKRTFQYQINMNSIFLKKKKEALVIISDGKEGGNHGAQETLSMGSSTPEWGLSPVRPGDTGSPRG